MHVELTIRLTPQTGVEVPARYGPDEPALEAAFIVEVHDGSTVMLLASYVAASEVPEHVAEAVRRYLNSRPD